MPKHTINREDYGQHWLDQLALAKANQKPWLEARNEAWDVFRNEGTSRMGDGIELEEGASSRAREFLDSHPLNMFWVSVEAQLPHIYSRKPIPIARRRMGRPSPAEAVAAEIIEKSLTVALDDDEHDPHRVFLRVATEYLVGGWGWTEAFYQEPRPIPEREPVPVAREGPDDDWIDPAGKVVAESIVEVDEDDPDQGKYVPPPPPGAEAMPEKVCLRFVRPDTVLVHPAACWPEVEWIATLETPTRKELEDRWEPEVLEKIRFHDPDSEEEDGDEPPGHESTTARPGKAPWDRARLWRIFVIADRTVVWVDDRAFESQSRRRNAGNPEYTQGIADADAGEQPNPGELVIEIEDDELGLAGFFPFPEPLTSVRSNNAITPVPEYRQMESVFLTIQEMMVQYFFLIYAIRMKGLVAGDMKELVEEMMSSPPWVQIFQQTKALPPEGIAKLVTWFPIEQVVNAAQNVRSIVQHLQELLYEVGGATDAIRGVTHPRTSAESDRRAATLGTGRLAIKKSNVEQHIRGALRLMAEIMVKHVDFETLEEMAGIRVRTEAEIGEERASVEEQIGQAEAQNRENEGTEGWEPINTAGLQTRMKELELEPTRKQVAAIFKSNSLRNMAIDLETDSTIIADQQMERQARAELLESVVRALQAIGNLLQVAPAFAPLATEVLAALVRDVPMSRDLVDKIKTFVPPPPPKPPPSPEEVRGRNALALQKQRLDYEAIQKSLERDSKVAIAELRADVEGDRQDMDALAQREQRALEKIELFVRDVVGKMIDARLKEIELEIRSREADAKIKQANKPAPKPASSGASK